MAINWNQIDLSGAIADAGKKTDEKLASRVSSLTRLTDDEVIEICPKPGDVQKLQNLMKIVKSAEDQNTKVNKIVENIEDFAGIVVKLLAKFA